MPPSTARTIDTTRPRRAASPAMTVGLLLMPALIAAGLLRERIDMPRGVELRPSPSGAVMLPDADAGSTRVQKAG